METENLPQEEASAEGEQLVERDIRERFRRMCEGYFENVCKKLVIEHKVLPLSQCYEIETFIRV